MCVANMNRYRGYKHAYGPDIINLNRYRGYKHKIIRCDRKRFSTSKQSPNALRVEEQFLKSRQKQIRKTVKIVVKLLSLDRNRT